MAKAPICEGCGNPKPRCVCLEEALRFQLDAVGISGYIREYPFAHPRRWRFDFCWPDHRLAAELEGGTWRNGAHTRGKGYAEDCVKYNAAALLGWRVLRFTSEMVRDGTALQTIEGALTDHAITIERNGQRFHIKGGD